MPWFKSVLLSSHLLLATLTDTEVELAAWSCVKGTVSFRHTAIAIAIGQGMNGDTDTPLDHQQSSLAIELDPARACETIGNERCSIPISHSWS
jgi:hypothetical protein